MIMPVFTDVAILILRIALGVVFVVHGWPKIKKPGWGKKMGYPFIISLLISIGEFFGGLGVLFGFLTQIAALGIFVIMLGALYYHVISWKHPFVMKNGSGYEYALVLVLMSLALVLLGGGAYSIDALLFN